MSNEKYKILALFGKSGAGKDTIKKWIVYNKKNYLNEIIPYTSRPPRDNEIDGVDYNFAPEEEFYRMDACSDVLVASEFNNWRYWTAKSSLNKNKINVGIFNVYEIENLLRDSRLEVLPVYIECQDRLRLLRCLCLDRGKNIDCHEVCRRFLADEKDFKNINFEYAIYDNNYNSGFDGFFELPQIKDFLKK